ncbi:MAG: hypothetical protein N2255_07895, partial [Kiritimatiellae bacterium]|nr:hypothetical protein [Kiritimatiellia bacterium]
SKVAFSRTFTAPVVVSGAQTVVLDVDSLLPCGSRLALGIWTGNRYYETRPFYLKPGRNCAMFPMGERTFKSAESNWQYQTTPGTAFEFGKLTVLIYSPMPGRVVLHNLRLIGR